MLPCLSHQYESLSKQLIPKTTTKFILWMNKRHVSLQWEFSLTFLHKNSKLFSGMSYIESKHILYVVCLWSYIKYTPKNQPSTLKAIMWLTNLYTKMRFPFYSRKSFTMWPLMIEPTDTIKCCENPKTFWTVAMKFHWI